MFQDVQGVTCGANQKFPMIIARLKIAGRRKSQISQNRRLFQYSRATEITNPPKSSPISIQPGDANRKSPKIVVRIKTAGRRKSQIPQNRRSFQDSRATQIANPPKSSPISRQPGDANHKSPKIVAHFKTARRRKSQIPQNRRLFQDGRATEITNFPKSSPVSRQPGDANHKFPKIVAYFKTARRRKSQISRNRRPPQTGRTTQIKNLSKSSPVSIQPGDANHKSPKIVARIKTAGRRKSRIPKNRRPYQDGRATEITNPPKSSLNTGSLKGYRVEQIKISH
ncbi:MULTISPECIES: hypothetical protein [unclassified Bilifractor]|uniref:hypothetical protein n=1 Tax=unclassified Bilifractor TaxID=2815795 RepID=UPI003F90713F